MSNFWQLTVKPAQVELSEPIQAIAEESRKFIELGSRKRVAL